MATQLTEYVDEYGRSGLVLETEGQAPGATGDILYIGAKARFVALSNGLALEIMDGSGDWIRQEEWTEA